MEPDKEVVTVEIIVDRFEPKYTCLFRLSWDICSQGFGEWQIRDDEDYQFWVNVIERVTGKTPEVAKKTPSKAKAIIDFFLVHGIGNLDGTYWPVNEDGKPMVLDNPEAIKDYFSKYKIKALGVETTIEDDFDIDR